MEDCLTIFFKLVLFGVKVRDLGLHGDVAVCWRRRIVVVDLIPKNPSFVKVIPNDDYETG